jgi:hypothetical protein
MDTLECSLYLISTCRHEDTSRAHQGRVRDCMSTESLMCTKTCILHSSGLWRTSSDLSSQHTTTKESSSGLSIPVVRACLGCETTDCGRSDWRSIIAGYAASRKLETLQMTSYNMHRSGGHSVTAAACLLQFTAACMIAVETLCMYSLRAVRRWSTKLKESSS